MKGADPARFEHRSIPINFGFENMDPIPDHSLPPELAQDRFEHEVLHSPVPVLVAFSAPWSRPCEILNPVLGEIMMSCADRLKTIRVNADDNPELSLWYGIESVPTLLFFLNGTLQGRLVGTVSREAILGKLRALLQGAGPTRDIPLGPDRHEPHRP